MGYVHGASSQEILFVHRVHVDCPYPPQANVRRELQGHPRGPSVHNSHVPVPVTHYGSGGILFQEVEGGEVFLTPADLSPGKAKCHQK